MRTVQANVDLVFDNSISDRARFVYILIGAYDTYPYVAAEDVAKSMGVNIGTIYKYINELIENGWLVRKILRQNGRVTGTEYHLNIKKCQSEIPW